MIWLLYNLLSVSNKWNEMKWNEVTSPTTGCAGGPASTPNDTLVCAVGAARDDDDDDDVDNPAQADVGVEEDVAVPHWICGGATSYPSNVSGSAGSWEQIFSSPDEIYRLFASAIHGVLFYTYRSFTHAPSKTLSAVNDTIVLSFFWHQIDSSAGRRIALVMLSALNYFFGVHALTIEWKSHLN